MTLKMMHKYGWWNVRGGNWCQVEMCTCPKALLEWQQVNIPVKLAKCRKQICKRCGRNSEKCFAKTTLSGKALMTNGKFACKVEGKNEIDIYTRAFVMWHRLHNIMTFESAQKKLKRCNRCGRNSHTIEKCYAKSTLAGKLIATDNHDRLSRMEVDSCIRALIEWQRLNMPTKIVQRMNMYLCQRCGRNSHSIEQCFAKTSLAGETINDSKSNTKFHALGMQGI